MAQGYVVQSGDTLGGIASRYGVPTSAVTGYRSGNPSLIFPGENLTIGGGAATGAPAAVRGAQVGAAIVSQPRNNPVPQSQPQYQPQQQAPQQSSGTVDPNNADSIKSMYSGYAGWNDPNAIINDFKATGGSGKGGPSVSAGFNSAQPTIDLQGVYDKAINDAGVSNLQAQSDAIGKQITDRQTALATATGKINDNPFYSEATRVGRIAKLNAAAQTDIGNLISQKTNQDNSVAKAKADAQVKLGIATNQYNIQNQQYQQNLQHFNTLLTSGALDSASGADIANISASTGMSTSEIGSIIKASQAKNAPKPQLMTIDDGTNQKVVAVDQNGNVLQETILGASTKKTKGNGKTPKETALQVKQSNIDQIKSNLAGAAGGDNYVSPNDYAAGLRDAIQAGYSVKQADQLLSGYKNPQNKDYYLPGG